MKKYFLILLIASLFIGCSEGEQKTNTATKNVTATSNIIAKNNSGISGTVTFTEIDGKVKMLAKIDGLQAGNHAIHIHEVGDCSAEDGSSAGGHWNPTNVDHGVWGTAPFHMGDIGNLEANSSGSGTISRETDLWCLSCDDEAKNIIGKAIIIHAGIDDFSSQPAGAAGDRIGCGEILVD